METTAGGQQNLINECAQKSEQESTTYCPRRNQKNKIKDAGRTSMAKFPVVIPNGPKSDRNLYQVNIA
jgi:hypothetical protein